MVSSRLKIKKIHKHSLWFDKYVYRIAVTDPNLFLIRDCKSLDDYVYRIKTHATERSLLNSYSRFEPNKTINTDLINTLLPLLSDKDMKTRQEGNTISFYSNDYTKFDKLFSTKCSKIKAEEATVMPAGIKYFRREPPAKYRVYLTSTKVSLDLVQELLEYIEKTPDLTPCVALDKWFTKRKLYKFSPVWLWNNHFIDFNDERNLMMMKLLFPEAIGKYYKLEKNTG